MTLDGAAGVVLHPHPSMGGDSSHPFVVDVAARLASRGVNVVTPDLRDPDVTVAAEQLRDVAESVQNDRLLLVGYSWGSVVTSHASPHGLVARVLVAPPASMQLGGMSGVPTLVLVPEHDQFGDLDAMRAASAGEQRVTVESVPGADHFLWGSIEPISERCVDWLSAVEL